MRGKKAKYLRKLAEQATVGKSNADYQVPQKFDNKGNGISMITTKFNNRIQGSCRVLDPSSTRAQYQHLKDLYKYYHGNVSFDG